MILAELKARLAEAGIRQVASSKKTEFGQKIRVTIFFSNDEKTVFPFKLKTMASLVTDSLNDDQPINREQYLSVLRQINPGTDPR